MKPVNQGQTSQYRFFPGPPPTQESCWSDQLRPKAIITLLGGQKEIDARQGRVVRPGCKAPGRLRVERVRYGDRGYCEVTVVEVDEYDTVCGFAFVIGCEPVVIIKAVKT